MKGEPDSVAGKEKLGGRKERPQTKAGARKAPARKTVGKKRGTVAPGRKAEGGKRKVEKKKAAKKRVSKKSRAGGSAPTVEPKKMGRPTIFSQGLADEICRRLALGESLRQICDGLDMPHRGTVKEWTLSNDDFSSQYARAREDGSDRILEEMKAIADDRSQDLIPGEFGPKPNNAAVQRARLQVDLRKWILEKREPERFGPKVQTEISGKGGKPMELTLSPEALEAIAKASAIAATVTAPAAELAKHLNERPRAGIRRIA